MEADEQPDQQQQRQHVDGTSLYVPLRIRRKREAEALEQAKAKKRMARGLNAVDERSLPQLQQEQSLQQEQGPQRSMRSLVEVSNELRDDLAVKDEDEEKEEELLKEEAFLLRNLNHDRAPLLAAKEVASGAVYKEVMKTSWQAPRHIRQRTTEENDEVRSKYRILVEGEHIAPPVTRFRDLKLPEALLKMLRKKNISKPTPIQMQGIPVALSGRDMIGVAFTGTGKTLTFVLPMLMRALEEELKMPLIGGEGPVGLIVVPSRELAQQIFDVIQEFSEQIRNNRGPSLRSLLCMGGINMRDQFDPLRMGCHMVVATPGRLMDMLSKRRINLDMCTFLCLDEADRLIDLGFDEDMRTVFGYFKAQRQTLMFSATMPPKIKDFASTSLVKPIVVNVGRAGAANLDVVQEVEYVKEENRMVYILQCLQKTPPPVLIFSSNQNDVDDIEMYLLIKGVKAVAIHGGKEQADRRAAIMGFKSGEKDILVATDVAGKGLDFPDIKHVINFDMPKEIEDYVHRIGRTGRSGKTGRATTFINLGVSETTLLDLKHLLREAKQRIPPFLLSIADPSERYVAAASSASEGCQYCGGLGHRVIDCPKFAAHKRSKVQASMGGGGDGIAGGY